MSTNDSALVQASQAYWDDKSFGMHRHGEDAWFEKYSQELLAMLPAGGRLADVGCGACEVTTHLAPHFASVVAFDFSDSMLQAARRRVEGLGLSNVEILKGTAQAFPPKVRSADVILSYGVVQYLTDAELAAHLYECARALAPGGIVCTGLVPDAGLQRIYYEDILVPNGRSLVGRMKLTSRRLKGRMSGDLLWDGIGNWFSKSRFAELAAGAGFEAEFRHCWFYEYRYHALLRRTAA